MKRRALVLSLLAIAVAGAGFALSRHDLTASTEAVVPDKVPPISTPARSPKEEGGQPVAASTHQPQANPFAVRTWEPPRPKTETLPPPPPQAPPLPFRLLGKIRDDGTVYMLQHGQRILDVRPGDDIDGIYTVDGAKNGQLDFVYRPLQIRQSLFVGTDP